MPNSTPTTKSTGGLKSPNSQVGYASPLLAHPRLSFSRLKTRMAPVLASSPFYAFGAVAEARRWKAKPHSPAPKRPITVTHIHNSASRLQGGEIDVQMAISVPHAAPVSTSSVTDDASDLTSTPPAKKRKNRPASMVKAGISSRGQRTTRILRYLRFFPAGVSGILFSLLIL
jgi:hypothetical protein